MEDIKALPMDDLMLTQRMWRGILNIVDDNGERKGRINLQERCGNGKEKE